MAHDRFITPVRWLALCLMMGLATLTQAADSKQSIINHYAAIFSDKPMASQIDAARELEWLGLSSPRLFDIVEQNMLASHQVEDDEHADYTAWMAKALGYSGNAKYRASLEKVADDAWHRNTQKHAANSLELLERHAKWNPIIGDTSRYDSTLSYTHNAYANMLRSDSLKLQRLAAKRLHYQSLQNPTLMALAASAAKQHLATDLDDPLAADTTAWLMKVLAGSRNPAHRAIVEDAAENAPNKKVRKYAEKYLR